MSSISRKKKKVRDIEFYSNDNNYFDEISTELENFDVWHNKNLL